MWATITRRRVFGGPGRNDQDKVLPFHLSGKKETPEFSASGADGGRVSSRYRRRGDSWLHISSSTSRKVFRRSDKSSRSCDSRVIRARSTSVSPRSPSAVERPVVSPSLTLVVLSAARKLHSPF